MYYCVEKNLAKNSAHGEKITNIRYVAGGGAHPTQLTVPIIRKVKLESEKIQPLQVFQKTKTFFEMQTNSEIFLKLQKKSKNPTNNLKIQAFLKQKNPQI